LWELAFKELLLFSAGNGGKSNIGKQVLGCQVLGLRKSILSRFCLS
jgi:hypothetical protein